MTLKKLLRDNAFNCRYKRKFSPDAEAMSHYVISDAKDNNPEKANRPLGYYVCLSCGYLHLGHERRKHRDAH